MSQWHCVALTSRASIGRFSGNGRNWWYLNHTKAEIISQFTHRTLLARWTARQCSTEAATLLISCLRYAHAKIVWSIVDRCPFSPWAGAAQCLRGQSQSSAICSLTPCRRQLLRPTWTFAFQISSDLIFCRLEESKHCDSSWRKGGNCWKLTKQNGYTNYNKTDSANISVKGCSSVPVYEIETH